MFWLILIIVVLLFSLNLLTLLVLLQLGNLQKTANRQMMQQALAAHGAAAGIMGGF